MNSTINLNLIGKRESFYKLFTENDYIIEIPTIQRDFAQGRKSKQEVRELFLQALYDYLEENKANRDLDFVYGSDDKVDGVNKFIPLDGQQRLTTLFLLHWYLALLSGNEAFESFRKALSPNGKSRFTYLTRPSSAEFMNALLANKVELSALLEADKDQENSLSKTIMDKGWYFLAWGFDPTISAMLTMLDAIHTKFKESAYFYDRLVSVESPIITFLFLDLKKFKLTEDLYIKMNSRGKPLTAFENFKAKFEQHISKIFGDIDKPFKLPPDNRPISKREYFAYQIDTKWADLFWNYRELVGKPNTFDEELMNFIRVIIANQYAIENFEQLDNLRELVRNESTTSELTENLSFYKFEGMGSLTKNCVNYLIEALDALKNGTQKIKSELSDISYFNANDIFEKALKYPISLPERVLFHAYLRFLIIHKIDRAGLHQWMRVIHNLVENSRIELIVDLVSAIKSIEHLLDFSNDILAYLRKPKSRVDFFVPWQVEEERLKAHLSSSDKWLTIIESSEKAIFHKGQIAYLFEFSGILEYFRKQDNVVWETAEEQQYLISFNSYFEKSSALFCIVDTKENNDYLVERALLSKGNYLIPASNNRLNFCSSKAVANYQRDFSWKRLLRITSDAEDPEFKVRRSYLKDLFDDNIFNSSSVAAGLVKMCNNLPDDWRTKFISNPDLIDYCEQGFICLTTSNEIELFGQSQLNHYHVNMLVYNLFLLCKEKADQFNPFDKILIEPVKNNEDPSYVHFTEWSHKGKRYGITIMRHKGAYCIDFMKEKGDKRQTEYSHEIQTILANNKLEWDEEIILFRIKKRTEKSAVDLVKAVCVDLVSLS